MLCLRAQREYGLFMMKTLLFPIFDCVICAPVLRRVLRRHEFTLILSRLNDPDAGQFGTEEPNQPRRIIRVSDYKTKMDKGSGFWQVDLTPNAQELLAFITPQGRVFKWKVMPFGVANAAALFQELMNKLLSILRRRPVVQELMSRGAQMEAHIEDVCLGTDNQEEHLILLCSTWGSTLAMSGGPPLPLGPNSDRC